MPHGPHWHSRRLRGLNPSGKTPLWRGESGELLGSWRSQTRPLRASQDCSGIQIRTTVHCVTDKQQTTVHNNASAVRKLAAIQAGKGSHGARGALHSQRNTLDRAAQRSPASRQQRQRSKCRHTQWVMIAFYALEVLPRRTICALLNWILTQQRTFRARALLVWQHLASR